MNKKALFWLLLVSLNVLFVNSTFAQEPEATSSTNSNQAYRGLRFGSNQRHMTELGLHGGLFMVVGDVSPKPGWGAGIHVRRALDYAFSIRVEGFYANAFGAEGRNSGGPNQSAANNYVLNGLGYADPAAKWFHNFKTAMYGGSIVGVWSLNSFNFKNSIKKLNWYILGGGGANAFKTFYDAKKGDQPYWQIPEYLQVDDAGTSNDRSNRKETLDRLKDVLDGSYETRAEIAQGRRRTSDAAQVNAHATVGLGIAFKLSPKINIGLEHQVLLLFGNESDLVDGYRWRTPQDLTQFRDVVNYTNVRINFNIGNKDKASEPLWWVAPLDLIAEDLAEVKARPKLDLTDTDKDGVIDMIDQEKDTPEGFPVDPRGMALDSDKDGIKDGEDQEPYSPPGYKTDSKGVAQLPDPGYVTREEIDQIVDTKLKDPQTGAAMAGAWFLPMIHFDFDKFYIRQSEYTKLHHIANLMKKYPSMKVVANGHTDRVAQDCYNELLSYNRAKAAIDFMVEKYGIPRERFILTYLGEKTTIVDSNTPNYVNRRVEFFVATNETEAPKPDCGVQKAGSNKPGGKPSYQGNKEAGY